MSAVLDWRLDPVLSAALIATGAAYFAGARRGAPWPAARTGAFLAGLLVLAAALQSGLHARGEELLSAHMVQHLLLTLLAPALLVLGAPVSLALRALPREAGRALAHALRRRAVRVATAPPFAWGAFCAVLVGTHLPAFYGAALRHSWLHELEHLLYIGSALLFFVAVLSSEPVPRRPPVVVRVLLVMAAMPVMTLVGIALMTLGQPAYPEYAATAAEHGVSALADQRTAGKIMWLGGTLPLAAGTVVAGWRALIREERRAVAAERRRAEVRAR